MKNTAIIIFAVVFVGILLFALLLKLCLWLNDFKEELKYLNEEIKRSNSEKRYYKKLRRRLWLSLLPFVRYKIK